jgi:hypothetical protein
MPDITGSHHTGYRSIDATPLGDADRLASGEAIAFDGNGSKGRRAGVGTLGFYGADLGSDRPTEGRVPAFLGLAERTGGVYLELNGENPPTVAEALKRTGLDYEVRKDALFFQPTGEAPVIGDGGELSTEQVPLGDPLPMTSRWVTTVGYPRDGGAPFPLTPCSPSYTVIQNDRALAVGDALSEGRLVALGKFGNPLGAACYGAWELGEGMTIGGGDPYRNFVTIVNRHDGQATYGLLAPIRLGCTNQTNATFGRKATPRFTIRHVGEAAFQLEEARRILGLAHEYMEVFAEESEALLATPMSKDRFVTYAKMVWGVKPDEELSKASAGIVKAREEKLLTILGSPTCAFGEGTAYAGYQAVTEYMDWFGTVRGGDDRRQLRIMGGELDAAKTKAWALATA